MLCVGARSEGEAEGLTIEFECREGACGSGVASCGGERGKSGVAGSYDDVELLRVEQEVQTFTAAGQLEVLFRRGYLLAKDAGLKGSHEVILVWTSWEVLVINDCWGEWGRTRWEGKLRMLEVEVDDFGKRVHFRTSEVADELG